MKQKIAILSAFTAVAFGLGGCASQSVEEHISKNPEVLFKAIEENPERFMQAVQSAAQKAQELAQQKREQQEQQELEAAINNPLKPEIRKDEAVLGPADAPITLISYSDFECPYCSRGSETVNSLLQKYAGKIRFVYKHLPLDFHPHAIISAQYFEAIKIQNPQKALEFHNKVFAEQNKLRNGEKFLKEVATSVGVDMKKLTKDIKSKEVLETIERHQAEAQRFNMHGTPGFLLNGIPIRGAYPAQYFVSLIERLEKEGKLTL